MKRTLSLLLTFLILLFTAAPAFAADYAPDFENDPDAARAIFLQPGSDESERNLSWYMPAGTKRFSVLLSESPDLSNARSFGGKAEPTPQKDLAAAVTVTGLKADTTYYYACETDGERSGVYSFTTAGGAFTALYTTDIHISDEPDEPGLWMRHAERWADVLAQARSKAGSLDLVLSAGDQATYGSRTEYTGLTASPLMKAVSFAPAIGNHDRKNVDFRYFTNLPNETARPLDSQQGGDYWFVKGNVLFLVMDSNNADGVGHSAFLREAIAKNPEAKWRVLMMHHDLWGQTIEHREKENRALRLLWTPMIDENDIDLALLGHSHYFSVSNVLVKGKTTERIGPNASLTNADGTVYMVSASINHPRGGDPFTYGPNVGVGVEDPTRIVYNLIDFTEDQITVKAVYYDTGEVFNTLTLKKTDEATPTAFSLWDLICRAFVGFIGRVYAVFNQIGNAHNLREKGVDASFLGHAVQTVLN